MRIPRRHWLWLALLSGGWLNVAYAGPPFLTDDADPEDYQHLQLITSASGFHTHGNTLATLPGLEADYGVAPNLEFNAVTSLSLDQPMNQPATYGPGDSQLGVKWRFIDEDKTGWRPKVAFSPVLYLPTGNAHRTLGQSDTQLLLPLWLGKDFGPWTTYGGGGYLASESHAGTQNAWQEGVVLLRQLTPQMQFGGELFHEDGGTPTDHGTGHPTIVNLGGTYILSDNQQLIFSAGRGLEQPRATALLDWYAGYQVTF